MRTNKLHLALVLGAAIALTLIYKRPEGFINAATDPSDNSLLLKRVQALENRLLMSRDPVIENAPAPAGAGMTQTLTPVNLDANYEELKRRLDNYELELPQTIGDRVSKLTPAIVRGMLVPAYSSYSNLLTAPYS